MDSAYSIVAIPKTNLPREVDLHIEQQLDFDIPASVDATAQTHEIEQVHEVETVAYTVPNKHKYHVVRKYYAYASWYNHGKITANGERFNQYGLTVAHKHLPFNTLVRFTNINNGRSIIVRVNDRGPFLPNREFDLTLAAAKYLNIVEIGLAKLMVEILN
jgi:rare lipoprotein A